MKHVLPRLFKPLVPFTVTAIMEQICIRRKASCNGADITVRFVIMHKFE